MDEAFSKVWESGFWEVFAAVRSEEGGLGGVVVLGGVSEVGVLRPLTTVSRRGTFRTCGVAVIAELR